MTANGKQPTALRAWDTSVRWPGDRTRNQLQLLVSQTSHSHIRSDHTFTDNCWFALDSHCDTGYLLYGDFCYYFETKMVKNWQDAEAHCTREQGHLASFHTEEELSFLIGELLRVQIKLWLKWSISLTHSINADVLLSWHFDSSHARGSLGGFEWH